MQFCFELLNICVLPFYLVFFFVVVVVVDIFVLYIV